MDFQNGERAIQGGEASFEHTAEGFAEAAPSGLSHQVSEALTDPIVQALMAADRVDPKHLEALLRHVAGRLASRPRQWRFS